MRRERDVGAAELILQIAEPRQQRLLALRVARGRRDLAAEDHRDALEIAALAPRALERVERGQVRVGDPQRAPRGSGPRRRRGRRGGTARRRDTSHRRARSATLSAASGAKPSSAVAAPARSPARSARSANSRSAWPRSSGVRRRSRRRRRSSTSGRSVSSASAGIAGAIGGDREAVAERAEPRELGAGIVDRARGTRGSRRATRAGATRPRRAWPAPRGAARPARRRRRARACARAPWGSAAAGSSAASHAAAAAVSISTRSPRARPSSRARRAPGRARARSPLCASSSASSWYARRRVVGRDSRRSSSVQRERLVEIGERGGEIGRALAAAHVGAPDEQRGALGRRRPRREHRVDPAALGDRHRRRARASCARRRARSPARAAAARSCARSQSARRRGGLAACDRTASRARPRARRRARTADLRRSSARRCRARRASRSRCRARRRRARDRTSPRRSRRAPRAPRRRSRRRRASRGAALRARVVGAAERDERARERELVARGDLLRQAEAAQPLVELGGGRVIAARGGGARRARRSHRPAADRARARAATRPRRRRASSRFASSVAERSRARARAVRVIAALLGEPRDLAPRLDRRAADRSPRGSSRSSRGPPDRRARARARPRARAARRPDRRADGRTRRRAAGAAATARAASVGARGARAQRGARARASAARRRADRRARRRPPRRRIVLERELVELRSRRAARARAAGAHRRARRARPDRRRPRRSRAARAASRWLAASRASPCASVIDASAACAGGKLRPPAERLARELEPVEEPRRPRRGEREDPLEQVAADRDHPRRAARDSRASPLRGGPSRSCWSTECIRSCAAASWMRVRRARRARRCGCPAGRSAISIAARADPHVRRARSRRPRASRQPAGGIRCQSSAPTRSISTSHSPRACGRSTTPGGIGRAEQRGEDAIGDHRPGRRQVAVDADVARERAQVRARVRRAGCGTTGRRPRARRPRARAPTTKPSPSRAATCVMPSPAR